MSIDRLDVPAAQVASDMAALIARQRQQAAADRLRWLLAHAVPAPAGELAEYRHLLHDVDADSTTPALVVSLVKNRPGRAS